MTTLQQLESLADAINLIASARTQMANVTPIWSVLNHAGKHLEQQMKGLLAE
jgi:hypothetical protein